MTVSTEKIGKKKKSMNIRAHLKKKKKQLY